MHDKDIQLLSAIGETFAPPRHEGDWHGGDKNSMAIVLDYYRHAPWFMRFAFLIASYVIDVCPLFVIGKPHLFRNMALADRERYLNRFARTMPFAIAFAPLRAFLALAIYSRADAVAETGYHNNGRRLV